MAQTVTFGGGNFDIVDNGNPGTAKLTVTPSNLNASPGSPPSYTFQNDNKSQIVGLGFQDSSTTGVTLTVDALSRTASASSSTFSFGTANDTLLIGRSLGNTYNMGDGGNKVTVQYTSTSDVLTFGQGVDTLVFGGAVQNTLVQLAVDSSVDTIKIAQASTPTTGLRITGATNIDVLFIGSAQYNYTGNGNWTNTTNPADTRNYG